MTVISSNPTSPARRFRVTVTSKDLHKEGPYLPLTSAKKKTGGRNNYGRITVRHIGGGHAQKYREIDFLRNKDGIPARVERLEYDPNRSAYIALVVYRDGERRYIIAPQGLAAGDQVLSGNDAPIKPGNCLPLHAIPVGASIHAIELKVGKGAQLIRSAGTSAVLMSREGSYAKVSLKSGEVREISVECRATIGEVSKSDHNLRSHGKAGAKRWLGVRPTVRGVAMNPVDHPHGGGEGKTSGGRHPVTPWGVATKGYKTRKNKRTKRFIVRSRHSEK